MNQRAARIAITGGSGYLGAALARTLLASGEIRLAGGPAQPIGKLVILDVQQPAEDIVGDPRVSAHIGDLGDHLPSLGDVDAIFHLAGVVSGAAEADFDLGMRVNLDATIALLEHARRMSEPPVLVFTSSLAVFGHDPSGPELGVVGDDTLPRPQSSYGAQKLIAELLVADYTRRGFIRGRSVRLMTVSVRAGAPNAAASSFMSGIIREPLAGVRSVCPVPADTPVALSSPARTIDGIVCAASVDDRRWGSRTAMNLPALTTTPREMVEALAIVSPGAQDLVDWKLDQNIIDVVTTWPATFHAERAAALGLTANNSFVEIVREYVAAVSPQPA